MKRRSFLTAASAAAAMPMLARLARAADRPFMFCSYGGALNETERAAFLDPFAKLKGIEILDTSPTEAAKILAMVEANKVEWDLVDMGGAECFQTADRGALEVLDLSRIPNAEKLPEAFRGPSGIVTSTGATIITWSTSAFPDGGPQSWADFWDVKNFPGPRGLYRRFTYNYEAALRAAGVKPDEIFPYTPEKRDMAFAKIRELKPNITVWWETGAQPAQLLSTGELAACSAWSGRVLAAIDEGAPIDYTYKDGVAWGNWWCIPKGSPYADVAQELINFALELDQQKALLPRRTYGPVLSEATEGLSDEEMKYLVMAPENLKSMVLLNEREGMRYKDDTVDSWPELMME